MQLILLYLLAVRMDYRRSFCPNACVRVHPRMPILLLKCGFFSSPNSHHHLTIYGHNLETSFLIPKLALRRSRKFCGLTWTLHRKYVLQSGWRRMVAQLVMTPSVTIGHQTSASWRDNLCLQKVANSWSKDIFFACGPMNSGFSQASTGGSLREKHLGFSCGGSDFQLRNTILSDSIEVPSGRSGSASKSSEALGWHLWDVV